MPVDNTIYNRFIDSLKIENISIPTLNWCLYKKPTAGRKLFTEAKLNILDPIIKKNSEITILAELEVLGFIEAPKKKKFMSITIVVSLKVKVEQKVFSQELAGAYINRNAIFTIIAIFREHVRNATFQMGLPTLILPAFKLNPTSKKDNNLKSNNAELTKESQL